MLTWAQYDERSSELAAVFVQAGLDPGTRIGVILPDGATVHTVFLAAEKAGLVVAGIGARAGPAEIRHLLGRMRATALVTHVHYRGQPSSELVASLRAGDLKGLRHVVVTDVAFAPGSPTVIDGNSMEAPRRTARERLLQGRALGPDDLFMLNSTSGTTGRPKCVMHTENRWFYFHRLATESGELTPDDVFFGAVPAPFGFGLWTAHFSPGVARLSDHCLRSVRAREGTAGHGQAPGVGIGLRQHAVHHDVEFPGAGTRRPHVAPRHVYGRRGGSVRASSGLRGSDRGQGPPILRIQRDRGAQRDRTDRFARASVRDGRKGDRRHAGTSLR